MAPTLPENVYFPNLEDPDLLGAALFDRINTYELYVSGNGLLQIWRLAYLYWYSQDEEGFTAHLIGKKGPKGKLAVLKLNHFRSIVKNWRTLAQSQRAAMQPVAKFNDSDSDRQVKRAKVVLDHYAKESLLDELKDEAIDISSYLGAAHLEQCWYDDGGELVLPGEGMVQMATPPPGELPQPPAPSVIPGIDAAPVEPVGVPPSAQALPPRLAYGGNGEIHTGTIEAHVYSPIDFIVDPMRMDHRATWCITRKYTSKWDIAARYAQDEEQYARIIGMSRPQDMKLKLELMFASKNEDGKADDIPLYTFWHEKTPACPNGKKVVFVAPDLVLSVEDLPFSKVPIKRIAPANVRRTPFGYSEAWDLLAPQRACDLLNSIGITNIKTFGVGNVLAPKGSGVKATPITEGLNLIEYNVVGTGGEPRPMQMPTVPKDVWDAEKRWVSEMGTLIGVNSVARGDPEKSLESGSALALVQAQAVQYSSDYQGQILAFESGVATDTIVLAQKCLKEEVEFAVVGDEVATLDKFAGKALDQILRVDVEPVNPMTKTMAGRWQLGTFLAQTYPQQVTPQQIITMLGTGKLDPITDDVQSESRNIQRENELLSKGIGPPPKVPMLDPMTGAPVIDPATGQPKMVRKGEPGKQYVRALLTDNPSRHAKKHIALLDSPAARNNPAVVAAVLDHLDEHEELYAFLTAGRPGLLQMLQIEPMQAAIPAVMPAADVAGGEAAAQEQSGGGGGAVRPPAPSVGQKQAPPDSSQPAQMPQFPKNPSTGDRFSPPPSPGG